MTTERPAAERPDRHTLVTLRSLDGGDAGTYRLPICHAPIYLMLGARLFAQARGDLEVTVYNELAPLRIAEQWRVWDTPPAPAARDGFGTFDQD